MVESTGHHLSVLHEPVDFEQETGHHDDHRLFRDLTGELYKLISSFSSITGFEINLTHSVLQFCAILEFNIIDVKNPVLCDD